MIVDKKTLADIFGVDERSITTWTKDGMPVHKTGGRGKSNDYDTVAIIAWHLERKVDKATAEGDFEPDSAMGAELIKQRTRKTAADADLSEHKLHIARLEVVPADQVLAAWSAIITDFRQAALQLPLRLAPMILQPLSMDEAKSVIEKETHAMLQGLARDPDYSVDLEALEDDEDPS